MLSSGARRSVACVGDLWLLAWESSSFALLPSRGCACRSPFQKWPLCKQCGGHQAADPALASVCMFSCCCDRALWPLHTEPVFGRQTLANLTAYLHEMNKYSVLQSWVNQYPLQWLLQTVWWPSVMEWVDKGRHLLGLAQSIQYGHTPHSYP